MSIREYEKFFEQVPMIIFSQLSIVSLDDKACIVKMPFIAENKNHLNSMYFGSIMIGTEVPAGILGLYHIKKMQQDSTVVFKDIAGGFLKRAESDVYFVCEDSEAIIAAVKETAETKARVNVTLTVIGVTDLTNRDEKVSEFKITLSVKSR